MSFDPVGEFLDSARQVGLLPAEATQTLNRDLRESGAATIHDAAARLVEKQLLTPFQAEQLLSGRGSECVLAGRYFLRQKLGEGAMGAVYLANDKKLDRQVAIKLLPPRSVADAGAIARFQREAKALARLSHPNIIQAHDSHEDAGRHFLVMEYAEGANLADVLHSQGRIAPLLAADYAYQAALGLREAHEKGLVHRDLKPGNLLLTPGGQVKILDLGLARFLQDHVGDATLTREGTGMGTPDYMPPEQFHDARHVDARSDIYSLGCTLYHLLAGRVPFPGTSMTEKYAAHEQQTPPPLDELRSDVPAGLSLAVQRMMAKRPADRFQSAREVAEALFPHVSGSSQSIREAKCTASWHGSQLGLSVVPLQVRRRRQIVAGSSVAAAILAIIALSFWAGGFRPPWTAGPPLGTPNPEQPPQPPSDPNTLTVAHDEPAQFKSIGEALAKVVRPNMTIQVLDDATYDEALYIGNRNRHEGLTLHANRGATISVSPPNKIGIYIQDVPRVTVRGFRFRTHPNSVGVVVAKVSPGVLLKDLECKSPSPAAESFSHIHIEAISLTREDDPIVVETCKLSGGSQGITIQGLNEQTKLPLPCRRIIIRDCEISNFSMAGILLSGAISDVQVSGNRISHCSMGGVALSNLLPGTTNVLIANNSLQNVQKCLVINNPTNGLKGVEIRNNLLLANQAPDLACIGQAADQGALASWRIEQNWRPTPPPPMDDQWAKEWVPTSKEDRSGPISLVSTDSASQDFLRPAKDSLLATDGAGKHDPSLPIYAGALPPEGVPAWDWRKTWDARHPKMLLTVSIDPQDKGEFRSINEALAQVVRPGMTIRVLDNATYTETIQLSQRSKHEGLTVEAVRRATLVPPADSKIGIVIQGVPRVAIRGFRIRSERQGVYLVVVSGSSAAVVLEGLEFEAAQASCYGASVEGTDLADDEPPVLIENCTFSALSIGIRISGVNAERAMRCRRVAVRNNRLFDCQFGIAVTGLVQTTHIAGNRIWDCGEVSVYITQLFENSGGILIANNTLKGDRKLLRVLAPVAPQTNVQIRNNVVLAGSGLDFVREGIELETLASWTVSDNWRQVRPPSTEAAKKEWIPDTNDRLLDRIDLLSIDVNDTNYLRPPEQSPLATAGAGGNLPTYVGALPPQGVDVWDWDKTWRSRQKSPSESSKQ